MPETLEDNPVEKVKELSDEELEERFERDTANFKNKLKEHSDE